jgi:putative FmdB family regulatory protein
MSPSYDFRCLKCGKSQLEVLPIAKRNDPIPCPDCQEIMQREASVPRMQIMFKPGYYHSVGQHCNTEQELRDKMDRARNHIYDKK